jgi:hypothetical protein
MSVLRFVDGIEFVSEEGTVKRPSMAIRKIILSAVLALEPPDCVIDRYRQARTERNGEGVTPSRRWMVSCGAMLSALSFAAFQVLSGVADQFAAYVGPIFLWWSGVNLILAVHAAIAPPEIWPIDRRGRYIVAGIGGVVGAWIGLGSIAWHSLLVLPIYCPLEMFALQRMAGEARSRPYMRLPIWALHLVGGELAGYLVGWMLRVTIA